MHQPELSFSNSELTRWCDCRRWWYLTYYLKKGPKEDDIPLSGPLVLGAVVHLALEYKNQHGINPHDVIERLHGHTIYRLLIRESKIGIFDMHARQEIQKDRELAHAMVEGFEEWINDTGADEFLQFDGAEVAVEVASGIPGIKLRGKLDKRVYRKTDNARLFEDYKTSQNFDGIGLLPISEQFKYYMMLEQLAIHEMNTTSPVAQHPTVGALYTVLRKVKRTVKAQPPFYRRVEIKYNSRSINSMWIRTHRRIQEILEARTQLDFGGDHRYWVYPRPSYDCSRKCPFFLLCPVMDDSSQETWQQMLNNRFDDCDPYQRYDDKHVIDTCREQLAQPVQTL